MRNCQTVLRALAFGAALAFAAPAAAQDSIKIGLLSDMSSVLSGAAGQGSVTAADASIAKLWLSEMQGRVIDRCLQCFGGNGYMWEYPVARAYADARAQRIYGGTSEIMKEIIARDFDGAAEGRRRFA